MKFIFALWMLFQASAQQTMTFDQYFKSGVDNYQKQAYDQAQQDFTSALKLKPNNISVLNNLALVEYQKGHKGAATAYLKKVLLLDPANTTAQSANKFIATQFQPREIAHEISFFENFRADFLNSFSEFNLDLLCGVFLFIFGWMIFSYLGKKKKFKNQPSSGFYPFATAISFLAFLGIFCLALVKNYDRSIPRAVIIQEKVSAYTAPDEKSTPLFDLYEGLEVQVERVDKNWVQVTYPGALTGWVPRQSLLSSSLQEL